MGKRSAPSPGTIALAGLMLLALAVIAGAVIAGNNGEDVGELIDGEIVMDPEVVLLDPDAEPTEDEYDLEGSATLNLQYKAEGLGFESEGSEEIFVVIEPYEDDQLEKWNVQGTKASTQSLDMAAGDAGVPFCWFLFRQQVVYTVLGTFTASDCRFNLRAPVALTSSELLSTDCPFDFPGGTNPLYMFPRPEDVVFTGSPQSKKLDFWTFTLDDVILPGALGRECPRFSQ